MIVGASVFFRGKSPCFSVESVGCWAVDIRWRTDQATHLLVVTTRLSSRSLVSHTLFVVTAHVELETFSIADALMIAFSLVLGCLLRCALIFSRGLYSSANKFAH